VKVRNLQKWAEIATDLGYSGKIMSSLSTSLKNSYQRWLQPYEEYVRIAKPGVQQQRHDAVQASISQNEAIPERSLPPPHTSNSTPLASVTNGANGHGSNHLKRTRSHDSLNRGDQTETEGANSNTGDRSSRRSKRLKKGKIRAST
jgi:[histone H3]-trimethyl-L-lysine4 demethylase